MVIYPDKKPIEHHNQTIICFAYNKDLIQVYDFYCARYQNISYNEFLNLGINEVMMKMESIPESEPLYTILKSRVVNLAKIKDKNERKHWRELKEINKIPDIYLPNEELDINMNNKLGGLNGKRFI